MVRTAQPFRLVYVHVPFCTAKCDYCAFYSVAGEQPALWAAYEQRFHETLAAQARRCGEVEAVFVGGGTPARLGAARLQRLLQAVQTQLPLAAGAEISVEMNPEFLTAEVIGALSASGVNRISLGVQSFQPELRQRLGRHGSLANLTAGLQALAAAGVGNVNFDLIYAIPGQTLAQWRLDLGRALDCGISHLSAYSLTLEEGTALAKAAVPVPDDELAVAMWEEADAVAARYGLQRYEVSNLAIPARQCRYNQAVWHGQPYLGLGPAASSFDGVERWTEPADLSAWLRGAPAEIDRLAPAARAAEVLAFGLRTVAGWERRQFRNCTGVDYMQLRGVELAELAEQGLLELRPAMVAPTRLGLLFADTVAERLL